MFYLSELDSARMEKLREAAANLAPGLYTLADICGDEWPRMIDYNSFSRKFKKTVEAGLMPGVSLHHDRRRNDALLYTRSLDENPQGES